MMGARASDVPSEARFLRSRVLKDVSLGLEDGSLERCVGVAILV